MLAGIASDHGGFALKEELVAKLRAAAHGVINFGAHELNPGDDYPDYVVPLAHAVATGNVERGVAICGSGVGASVCAHKVQGVRAALIHDHFSANKGSKMIIGAFYAWVAERWDRRWHGTSYRHSWPPSLATQTGTSAA